METILRRERLILGSCLAAMVILAWIYLFHLKTAMPGMSMAGTDLPDMDMPGMDMPAMAQPGIQAWSAVTIDCFL